jgi:transglutaminase-like putative cysteine protease
MRVWAYFRAFGVQFWLQTVALLYLTVHFWLYVRGDASLLCMLALVGIALVAGVMAERSRLRFLFAFILWTGFLVILYLLVSFVLTQLSSPEAVPRRDFLVFRFDKNYLLALTPAMGVWLLTFIRLRYPRFGRWEVIVSAGLLALLFFPQTDTELTFYPHPLLLAVSVGGFILLELMVLLAGTRKAIRWRKFLFFFLIIVPLVLLMGFALLQKYSEEVVTRGGGLIKPTLFQFDFSQYITLESSIEVSDDLVLLLRMDERRESILVRRFILSDYSQKRGFYRDQRTSFESTIQHVPDQEVTLEDPGYPGRKPVEQEYYLVNFDPASLLALHYPVRITPLENWDKSSFVRIYRVVSQAGTELYWELADSGEPRMATERYRHYTDYGGDETIAEYARTITEGAENNYEKVSRILAHLQDNYYYSIHPGVSAEGNQLHHFLFTSKKGYCSYFAFAMALMVRSLDIPARVAVGFWVDPESEVLNFYPVREDMAHAWVEVYFATYGWIEFDPTSRQLAPGEEFRPGETNPEQLASLIEEIMTNELRPQEQPPGEEDQGPDKEGDGFLQDLVGLATKYWYGLLPGLYLVLLSLSWLAPLARVALTGRQKRREDIRRRFFLSLKRLRVLGWPRLESETLEEYGRRIESETLEEYGRRIESETHLQFVPWLHWYQASRFAPRFTEEDYAAALEARARFCRALRTSVPLIRRILGFFNPAGIVFTRRRFHL